MTENTPRAGKSDIVATLTALLNDLRPAVADAVGLTREVEALSIKAAKAEKAAAEAARGDTTAPISVPEREDLNETYIRRMAVFQRCCEIWERARKPIISYAMLDEQSGSILAEFHLLPEHPNADAFQRCVEFLEIILEIGAPEHTQGERLQPELAQGERVAVEAAKTEAAPNEPVQAQRTQVDDSHERKPRGRPIEIPEELKARALEVFRANRRGERSLAAAKILYLTKYPAKGQRDNVSSILGAYCKKHGLDWPPPEGHAE